MKHSKLKAWLALFIAFDIWLIADIWTKHWAASDSFSPIQLIGDFFALIPFHKNDGIAFGINVPSYLQIGGSVLILIFLLGFGVKHIKEQKKSGIWTGIFLGAVIAGGVGNLIERIGQGFVVDFIKLGPIPIFNIADVGITVGLLLLFVTMMRETPSNSLKGGGFNGLK